MRLRQLRRATSAGQWVPEIDGLRFIAITSVVLFHILGQVQLRSGRVLPIEHAWRFLFLPLSNGDRGVQLFFVISGMILARPFAHQYLLGEKKVDLRRYYMRRLTRLEPPYLLSILLLVGLVEIYTHGRPGPGFAGHVLATMAYVHTQTYAQLPINFVAWSLEVEIQFYILAPLVMRLFCIPRKAVRRSVLLTLMLGMGLLQLHGPEGIRFTGSILFYGNFFIAGLLVTDFWTLDLHDRRHGWKWDVVGFSTLALLFTVPTTALAHTFMPFLIVLICLATLRGQRLRRWLATPWVAVLGGMCYSIYLLHATVITAVFKVSRYLILPQALLIENYMIQVLALGVPVLVLSVLYFSFIEQPCMRPEWPTRLWTTLGSRFGSRIHALEPEPAGFQNENSQIILASNARS